MLDMLKLIKKGTLRERVERIIEHNTDHYSFTKQFVQIAGKSGGLLTVMCPHGICVGFKVLYLHEGASDYVQFLRSWQHIPSISIVNFAHQVARHAEKQFPGMLPPYGGKLADSSKPEIPQFIKSGGLISLDELWEHKVPAMKSNPRDHPITKSSNKYLLFDRFHEVKSKNPLDNRHISSVGYLCTATE